MELEEKLSFTWFDHYGNEHAGQFWSLAPVPMWESSAYWVISDRKLVKVIRHRGKLVQASLRDG